ncbi:hypothetical protein Aple_014690 [Acrocarpospora pleiomorpha]|uniref:Secreted protein n=1 Tax=Acrocarpospora pleiomorpha TaxID=90975 RepID=A0A5M3XBM4_9ACTN|nr:hypothetical protein [Acrocarpospora pleiomorpha]GES18574.1 hypothetical protein Aple_014690 [Acrocarpospora pleiomorpha]
MKTLLGVAATAALITTCAIVTTPPASASATQEQVAASMGCQSSRAVLRFRDNTTGSYYCSGVHAVGKRADYFTANGWSGWLDTTEGDILFCDGERFPVLGVHVYNLVLNETKPGWCP